MRREAQLGIWEPSTLCMFATRLMRREPEDWNLEGSQRTLGTFVKRFPHAQSEILWMLRQGVLFDMCLMRGLACDNLFDGNCKQGSGKPAVQQPAVRAGELNSCGCPLLGKHCLLCLQLKIPMAKLLCRRQTCGFWGRRCENVLLQLNRFMMTLVGFSRAISAGTSAWGLLRVSLAFVS